MVEGLAGARSDVCVTSTPPGGLFVWVRFPVDVDQDKLLRLTADDR